MNAVRIFNQGGADELIFFDTSAAASRQCLSLDLVRLIGDEAFMPFTVGGGITTLRQISELLMNGAERVSISTAAVLDHSFVEQAAREFASSSIVVTLDYMTRWFHGPEIFTHGGRRRTRLDPVSMARRMEEAGAGELVLNCIERDGTMGGYDLDVISAVTNAVRIPVIASGGAGTMQDFVAAVDAGAAAVAAGSLFVYSGRRRGVLVNYPERSKLRSLFRAD